ncbi:MAG: metallophosphoesterase [Hydrogenoanaerobacterium sp.]
MSIYAIGDLHLSLGTDKPMDVFAGWNGYVERLAEGWKSQIKSEDTVVLAGDTSWAMSLQNTLDDFKFINDLPGHKYIIKGNHDYWWNSKTKMEAFFAENGLDTLHILHNSAVKAEGLVLCGTRGWLFEKGAPHDKKISLREAARLQMSFDAAKSMSGERVVFLHYPPVYCDDILPEIVDVMLKNGVKRCFYGHIHSTGCVYALNGEYLGIDFRLISSDFLNFKPIKIAQILEI